MDAIETFHEAIAAIPRDPLILFEAAIHRISDAELGQIPAEIKERILTGKLPQLALLAKEIFEQGGGWQKLSVLADAHQWDLRKALQVERTSGALKPITPATEIERSLPRLKQCAWNAFEVDLLISMMRDGERIERVDFRSVKTSRREISRGDLRERLPAGVSNISSWERQFTSERDIAAAEEERRQRENPPRTAFNHDFPNGVRPAQWTK